MSVNLSSLKTWSADPHQYGAGKVHLIDDEAEDKTICGRLLSAVPGRTTAGAKPTCRICMDSAAKRPERDRMRKEYEQRAADMQRQREEEDRNWHRWYEGYLTSEAWKIRRAKVMKRAGGICEGCGVAKATEVHHTTYQHVGNELLWELRAICGECHRRVTKLDQETRQKS